MTTSSMSQSLVSTSDPKSPFLTGSFLKSSDCLKGLGCASLSFALTPAAKRQLHTWTGFTLQAAYSDVGRSGMTNAFIGAFVLRELLIGALG